MSIRLPQALLLAVAAALGAMAALPAHAHHPVGGTTPGTAWEGLLSGLGHPVIEFDHLVFLLAVAALVTLTPSLHGRRLAGGMAGFVAASTLGTGLSLAGVMLPFGEALVGSTLLLVALGLLLPGLRQTRWVLPFCLAAAAVHGHAYGEAVAGAAGATVLAYLAGLALMQSALIGGGARLGRRLSK